MPTPDPTTVPAATRPLDLHMPPIHLSGIDALVAWLDAHLANAADRSAIAQSARDCIARFAHVPDLPATVEFWPLSRGRRYGLSYASADRGVTAYLEIRLAPCLAGTEADRD
jgi:hypothetical protein